MYRRLYVKNEKKSHKRKHHKEEKLISYNIITTFKFILFFLLFAFTFYMFKKVSFKLKTQTDNNLSYNISKYNRNHSRYFFHDEFKNRKIFHMDYSDNAYFNIDKSLSYEENAEKIYQLTGILNITKLDYFYYNNKTNNYCNYNHIHLSSAFDVNYIYLSSASFASILNTSNSNTYIHFHLIVTDSKYEDMKKLIQLKKINNNVEFIFYNGQQVYYDFGSRSISHIKDRGIGDCAKMILPEIVNNTDKIIIIDSGDILAQKDLSEVFFYDLEDNYFGWTLEYFAGCKDRWYNFAENKFFPNAGICLVNVTLFRKDKLYERIYYSAMAYDFLQGPYQDIYFLISDYKVKFLPLNYNCKQFFDNDEQLINRVNDTKYIKFYMDIQKNSPFKYTIEEIFDAASDPVIVHIYHEKTYKGTANKKYTLQWINYVKLADFYEEIKKLYPKPFDLFENK